MRVAAQWPYKRGTTVYIIGNMYTFIITKHFNLFYRNPKTRFYTTLYPKPVVLSAGTSFSLPITFRPLEKVVYEDSIEFHTKVSTVNRINYSQIYIKRSPLGQRKSGPFIRNLIEN